MRVLLSCFFSILKEVDLENVSPSFRWNPVFFTVCNFGNILAMTIIFFLKLVKFDVDFRKGTKNSEKVFRFPDTCIWIGSWKFWQYWAGYLPSAVNVLKTPLRFNLTLGETFSKSTFLKMMKNMIKAPSRRFCKYLGWFHMLTVKSFSEKTLLRDWSNQDFQSL